MRKSDRRTKQLVNFNVVDDIVRFFKKQPLRKNRIDDPRWLPMHRHFETQSYANNIKLIPLFLALSLIHLKETIGDSCDKANLHLFYTNSSVLETTSIRDK